MTGSPFARTEEPLGVGVEDRLLRLAQVEAADHADAARVRLAHDVAEEIAARRQEGAGIVEGHARRILRDDPAHVDRERCSRRSLRRRRRAARGRRVESVSLRLVWRKRIGSRFHQDPSTGRAAGEACCAEPIGIVGPLAAIMSNPTTVQPRSVSRERRRTSISARLKREPGGLTGRRLGLYGRNRVASWE